MLAYCYGAALLAGGAMGYLKSGSLMSLVAGGSSGLLIMALEAAAKPSTLRALSLVQGLSALLLTFVMGMRYAKSGASVPLYVAALSAAASLSFLLRASAAKR